MPRPHELLAVVALVACCAPSCKGQSKADCNQACEHLLDLAREDIKTQPIAEHLKLNLIDQADKSRPADLQACVAKCNAGDWNGTCLLEAKTFLSAKGCK